MLILASRIIGAPVLSMQAAGKIAEISGVIVDPEDLKIIAFRVSGPLIGKRAENILVVDSIREYSRMGMIIDSEDEFVASEDVVRVNKVLELNFELVGLKVETKKGSRLGKVSDFAVFSDTFHVEQLIVKRPIYKSFIDPELTIPRNEISEVTDYKVIVKDEEKTIVEKAETEEFVSNFVNPFRKNGEYAPVEESERDAGE